MSCWVVEYESGYGWTFVVYYKRDETADERVYDWKSTVFEAEVSRQECLEWLRIDQEEAGFEKQREEGNAARSSSSHE